MGIHTKEDHLLIGHMVPEASQKRDHGRPGAHTQDFPVSYSQYELASRSLVIIILYYIINREKLVSQGVWRQQWVLEHLSLLPVSTCDFFRLRYDFCLCLLTFHLKFCAING